MEKIAFIGMGNMAQALAAGFIKSKKIKAANIFAFAPNQEKLARNAKKLHFIPCKTVQDAVKSADTIFFSCKPYQIESVLLETSSLLKNKTIVSIALGWNFKRFAESKIFNSNESHIQFVMPNTPAMVGEGVFLFEKTNSLEPQKRADLWALFEKLGLVEELPDNLMAIGGAISGCGPAFADLFIESYADAAVKYGIPRSTAYRLVSKMLAGSAKLQLETGIHPAVLKDNVTSPAGSTIRGVAALEENGLRNACIKSIDAIMNM